MKKFKQFEKDLMEALDATAVHDVDLGEDEHFIWDEIKERKGFVTQDSGERQEYPSGMRRDTQAGKPRYDLIDLPFLRRWAELMARGAEKYGERNWELAESQGELDRFKQSALRHMFQWLEGDTNEDHAAAIAFNVAAAEHTADKLLDDNRL